MRVFRAARIDKDRWMGDSGVFCCGSSLSNGPLKIESAVERSPVPWQIDPSRYWTIRGIEGIESGGRLDSNSFKTESSFLAAPQALRPQRANTSCACI